MKLILSKQVLLHGLSSEAIAKIAELSVLKAFKEGAQLVREGDEAGEFYIIREGKVRVEARMEGCEPLEIQYLGTGELFGWSWIVPPYRWTFDAVAAESLEVIAIDGRALRKECDKDPELGYELMKRLTRVMSMRLQETRFKMLDYYRRLNQPRAVP